MLVTKMNVEPRHQKLGTIFLAFEWIKRLTLRKDVIYRRLCTSRESDVAFFGTSGPRERGIGTFEQYVNYGVSITSNIT